MFVFLCLLLVLLVSEMSRRSAEGMNEDLYLSLLQCSVSGLLLLELNLICGLSGWVVSFNMILTFFRMRVLYKSSRRGKLCFVILDAFLISLFIPLGYP